MIRMFRFCGALTVFILWSSILIAINKINLSIFENKPLSSLGTQAESAPYFTGGLLIAVLSLILFVIYLHQNYRINRSFLIFLTVGQLGQIIAAIIPYGGDQPGRGIHSIAALTLAFSIPFMLLSFARAQTDEEIRRNAFLLMSLEIVAFIIGIGMFTFTFKGAPLGQIFPVVAFHVWLVYFSFRRPVSSAKF